MDLPSNRPNRVSYTEGFALADSVSTEKFFFERLQFLKSLRAILVPDVVRSLQALGLLPLAAYSLFANLAQCAASDARDAPTSVA